MRIFCAKCKDDTEPFIDAETLVKKTVTKDTKAICPKCKSYLPMTIFAMKTLHSMKRLFDPKPTQAFQYKCNSCRDYKEAAITADGLQAVCSSCKSPFNLTSFMLTALKLAKTKKLESTPDQDLQEVQGKLK